MRPYKLTLNEKEKRLSILIEFFLMDKIYFCNIKNFLTNFVRYVKNSFSRHISFLIGIYK